MKFVTIRELRSSTAQLRKDLQKDREIVVTANGRPFALMTPIEPDNVEEEVLALRRARAQAALSRARQARGGRGVPVDLDVEMAREDGRMTTQGTATISLPSGRA